MPLPRNGWVQPVEIVGGGGGGIDVVINGVTQVQNIESVAPLGAGITFAGAARDCLLFESYGISVLLDPASGKAVACTVLVENSTNGITFREVDSFSVAGAVDATKTVNRVYSVCRQYYRVSVTNNGADTLTATEVISMQKPV